MRKSYFLTAAIFLIFGLNTYSASPASLSFDPVAQTVNKQEKFPVAIQMFSGEEQIASSDIWINFDPQKLEPILSETKNGDIFGTVDTKIISPGVLYLYAIQNTKSLVKPALGTVATIYFKGKNSGNTQLNFSCTSTRGKSSQIIALKESLTNIINCPATLSHTSSINVTDNQSVLGVSSLNSGLWNNKFITYGLGVFVLLFTIYLIIKYQKSGGRSIK